MSDIEINFIVIFFTMALIFMIGAIAFIFLDWWESRR